MLPPDLAEPNARGANMITIHQHQVLMTGFGPFPGVPFNASAWLVQSLSEAARARWPEHRFVARVLPTEWIAGPEMLHGLWDELRPDIALHFGVARDALGLQLETAARNHCRMDPDAGGALPPGFQRVAGGANVLFSSLPLEAIMRRLAVLRVPGCISDDAGAYLCNSILYESISRASAARPVALSGFVHIPSKLAGLDRLQVAVDCPPSLPSMSIDEAVLGGLAILECALEHLARRRAEATAANISHDLPHEG